MVVRGRGNLEGNKRDTKYMHRYPKLPCARRIQLPVGNEQRPNRKWERDGELVVKQPGIDTIRSQRLPYNSLVELQEDGASAPPAARGTK